MKITSGTDTDMEIFLTAVGEHLGKIGAEATIDLYTDTEIDEPEPNRLLVAMQQAALADSTGRGGGDPYMGVPLDLTTSDGLTDFARLAHRTIGCEAFLGRKLVFTTIENERMVCLDLPDGDVEALEAQARHAGATTLSHVA
ncbi:hypothetical protein ACFU76_17895 [Streptomyces sp. NPDC057539]|uniref:hypothetical protein n=1 Tax=Streptomyces sp. NPDC057539 TaxID=3346159 RepID=UPI003678F074